MTTEFTFQRDARSLIRNGNLSQGTSFWSGSFLSHVAGDAASTETPAHLLTISTGEFPTGTPPGALQFLDRPDLYSFGSTRFVSMLAMIPFSPQRAMLKVVQGTTQLDGVVLDDKVVESVQLDLQDYSQELIFQNPFNHADLIDTDGVKTLIHVSPQPGSSVPVTDYTGSLTGLYRAAKLLRGSAHTPGDVSALQDLTKFRSEALEITPLSGKTFTPLLEESHIDIDRVFIREVGFTLEFVVVGDADALHAAFSLSIIDATVSVIAPTFGVGVVTQARVESGEWVLTLQGLSNGTIAVEGVVAPLPVPGTPTEWYSYSRSFVGCSRKLPLFRFTFSAAYTYPLGGIYAEPRLPVLEFYGLSDTEIYGTGTVVNNVGAELSKTRTVLLDTGVERKVVAFDRETTKLTEGRLALRFPGPPEPFTAVLVRVDAGPAFAGSLQSFDYQFFIPDTVPFPSELLAPAAPFPPFSITTDTTFSASYSWMQMLVDAGTVEPTTLATIITQQQHQGSPGILVTFSATISVTASVAGAGWTADLTPSGTVTYNLESSLLGAEPVCAVGDVAMYVGELTSVFEVVDSLIGDPPVFDENLSFDPLITKLDHEEGAIPKGAVMLYVGGGVCPPGFARVNQLAGGLDEGILTIPLPDLVTYDSTRDESVLFWESLLVPVVDAAGKPMPIPAADVVISIADTTAGAGPDDKLEFTVQRAQPQIQPGMTIRTVGDADATTQGDGESRNTNWFVSDSRPGVPVDSGSSVAPSATPAPYNEITPAGFSSGMVDYPYFVEEKAIEPPYRKDIPIGPHVLDQQELFAGDRLFRAEMEYATQVIVSPAGQVNQIRPRALNTPSWALSHPWLNNQPTEVIAEGDVVWADWITGLPYYVAESHDSATNSTALDPAYASSPDYSSPVDKFRTAFLARVVGIVVESSYTEYRLERYDGKPMFVPNGTDLTDASELSNYLYTTEDALGIPVPTMLTLRPARLFGVNGAQQDEPGPSSAVVAGLNPGVLATSVVTGNSDKALSKKGSVTWVVQRGLSSLSVTVPGNFDVTTGALLVEPGGYLRYDEPDSALDYGAGGHSHTVDISTSSPFNQQVVPAFAYSVSSPISQIAAAASHGHGSLSKYRYNLPRFRMFTVCEKL